MPMCVETSKRRNVFLFLSNLSVRVDLVSLLAGPYPDLPVVELSDDGVGVDLCLYTINVNR